MVGFEFGQKSEPRNYDEQLRAIALQLEELNSRPAQQKELTEISQKLRFLYEMMQGMEASTKSHKDQLQSLTGTLQKNFADLSAVQQEAAKAMAAVKSPDIAKEDVEQIKTTLKELVAVYREEVDVFRKQNTFMQRKLSEIDQRLGRLEQNNHQG